MNSFLPFQGTALLVPQSQSLPVVVFAVTVCLEPGRRNVCGAADGLSQERELCAAQPLRCTWRFVR